MLVRHTREEVIDRTEREFEILDRLIANLSEAEWDLHAPRRENEEAWTIKDAVAHITHWKADIARAARRKRRPPEEQGLNEFDGNHLVYARWHARTPQEVLAWHRQVHEDVLRALREAPDEWFSGRARRKMWPYDLDGHSAFHRVKDIEGALKSKR
jgi:hypothetical protein